jgi:IS30 family transposase
VSGGRDAVASMPFDQPVEIAEMNYTHLTREERYQIYALKKAGHTQVEIAQVLARKRIGDWEADTIIGKNHKQAIVSIVERRSGFTLIRKVERKTAQAVGAAMTALLKPYRKKVHTITSDNGREFAGHEAVASTVKADFYFAHPYASWERGTNEKTNGLIRQYFPKHRDFTTITQQEIDMAMERLNNRPRKRLGYLTPNQVFFKSSVALHI